MRAGDAPLMAELERCMRERGVGGDVTTRNIRLQHLLATDPGEGAAFFGALMADQGRYLQE